MSVIYKATNKINGKAYIGFDSNWPVRKLNHIWYSTSNDEKCPAFHRALKKYGEVNFEWEIIKESATLDDEIQMIAEHNTYCNTGHGYNLTKGGDGNLGWIMSEETKKKISDKAKGNKKCSGRHMSIETRNKISIALKNKMIGKPPKSPRQHKDKKQRMVTEKQLYVLRENARKMKESGHTEEAKKKISDKIGGRRLTEEHKLKISTNHASKRDSGKFYQSEEYKEKMRKSCTGIKRTPEQRERYRLAAIKRHAIQKQKATEGF